MKTAAVIQAGLDTHPESGRRCMKTMVKLPWASAGVTYPATDVWAEAQAPIPEDGDMVSWDDHWVIINGRAWHKVEDDSNPDAPLH